MSFETFDSLWDGLVDNLKHQMDVNGEAICHQQVMAQALLELIIGPDDKRKYAAALDTFTKELKAKCRLEERPSGIVFIFSREPHVE